MNKIYHPNLSVHQAFKCGTGCTIHSHTWIGRDVKIGDNCKIQAFAFIPEGVEIGNGVFIGPGVVFTNDKYPPSGGKHWRKTIVEDGASIGANATIVCGIVIGKGAMVGAGAVATKNIPAGEIWCGNPAKCLKKK